MWVAAAPPAGCGADPTFTGLRNPQGQAFNNQGDHLVLAGYIRQKQVPREKAGAKPATKVGSFFCSRAIKVATVGFLRRLG